MTSDILLLVGELVALWCIGFAGGFVLTRFKEAMTYAGSD